MEDGIFSPKRSLGQIRESFGATFATAGLSCVSVLLCTRPAVPASGYYTICGTVISEKQRQRQRHQGHAGVLDREREKESRMEDDETKIKEQSWWLSCFSVGCSYSIKPYMALSAAATADRPAQLSLCHRLSLMLHGGVEAEWKGRRGEEGRRGRGW